MAYDPDPPDDATDAILAPNAWSLGILVRAEEFRGLFPLGMTFRAWWTGAPSTSTAGMSAPVGELGGAVAQHAGEDTRTAAHLARLGEECATALHDARAARQAAAEVGEAQARIAAALEAACRRAEERCAALEAASAGHRSERSAWESREAALRADLDAARRGTPDDPERLCAAAELERVRASLAEAETALHAMRSELAQATSRVAALSKAQDETTADRARLAEELAAAKTALASATDAVRRESRVAETAQAEREAQWHDERAALLVARRQAEEHGAELETALAQAREQIAAGERREATFRAELETARTPAQDDSHVVPAEAELERVRVSLAEAETALRSTRTELERTTSQVASLSSAHDQAVADRCRVAAELAAAEERVAELERHLEETVGVPPPASRPIPF